MENMNFGDDYSHLQAYYSSKLLKIVGELNKKAIVWEGIFVTSSLFRLNIFLKFCSFIDVYENGVKVNFPKYCVTLFRERAFNNFNLRLILVQKYNFGKVRTKTLVGQILLIK